MKKSLAVFLIFIAFSIHGQDENDTTTSQDAIFDRPFISLGKTRTAVGGYLEGNTNYFVTDGIKEGFSMEFRRFNIFLYSTISDRIKFLSELEFEHGTEEIALETALVDFEINPSLVFRAGILLPPIGGFNQNHDSPKWEFVERPLVSTYIIPSTLSEIGFGFNGKFYPRDLIVTYDIYLVQGLGDGIILNNEGRTSLQAGKFEERFAFDNNSSPAITGKLGIRHRKIGEIGLSYYDGAYNTFQIEGQSIDQRRGVRIYAIDFRSSIKDFTIVGEAAYNMVDVPENLSPLLGDRQAGFFTDIIYPVLKRKMLRWQKAVLNFNVRVEMVDLNIGAFSDGSKVYDEITVLAFGPSFRPSSNTVIRANYRYHWIRDFAGNPTIRQAGIQIGLASYF